MKFLKVKKWWMLLLEATFTDFSSINLNPNLMVKMTIGCKVYAEDIIMILHLDMPLKLKLLILQIILFID